MRNGRSILYKKKYEDGLEKYHKESVESSTIGVELRETEHYKSITDVEKDHLENIKSFTKALINSNNSEKVILELGKDIINGDVISAKARLEALKDRKKPIS